MYSPCPRAANKFQNSLPRAKTGDDASSCEAESRKEIRSCQIGEFNTTLGLIALVKKKDVGCKISSCLKCICLFF